MNHGPTPAGFLQFVRDQAGIAAPALPDNSPYLTWSYDIALEIVNLQLAVSAPIYALAVYNLGVSNLINFAPDNTPSTFFSDARKAWNVMNFVSGVVQNAGDQGTGDGLLLPDAFKGLTIADLQYLKDPWGRQYLAFAQRVGTLWGLS